MICPGCGKEVLVAAKFCPYCGAAMGGAALEELPRTSDGITPDGQTAVGKKGKKAKKEKRVKDPNGKKRHVGLIITLCVLLALIIAAAAFLWFLTRQKNDEYQSMLDDAAKLAKKGDYSAAAKAYEGASELLPRRAEAHLGRAKASLELGDYSAAIDGAEDALALDAKLTEAYLCLADARLLLGDDSAARDTLADGMLEAPSDELTAWAKALDEAEGAYKLGGAVSKYVDEGVSAVAGASVRLYDGDRRLLRAARADGEGLFTLPRLAKGSYILDVDAAGCETLETAVTVGGVEYLEPLVLISTTDDEPAPIAGTVTNALDGGPLAGASVTVRRGWNAPDGDKAGGAVTDENGRYSVEGLPAGYYTVEITAEGFGSAVMNAAALPDDFDARWNASLTPAAGNGETHIVLTWGDAPRDLDAHIYNDSFHVWFDDPSSSDGGAAVTLDSDADAGGAEVITVSGTLKERAVYFVHRYDGDGTLASSGATVTVYRGGSVVATYRVPADLEGDSWVVFSLEPDGSIVTINSDKV